MTCRLQSTIEHALKSRSESYVTDKHISMQNGQVDLPLLIRLSCMSWRVKWVLVHYGQRLVQGIREGVVGIILIDWLVQGICGSLCGGNVNCRLFLLSKQLFQEFQTKRTFTLFRAGRSDIFFKHKSRVCFLCNRLRCYGRNESTASFQKRLHNLRASRRMQ